MLYSARSRRGMVTAPHHLAAQAGLDILKAGGNAVEAAVAVAAALAVLYPHMTGIGGDGFWLIRWPDGKMNAIDACGRAAHLATPALYNGLESVPWRGGLAANTVAGTISGWDAALAQAGGALPLSRLLQDAIDYAEQGIVVTESLAGLLAMHRHALQEVPGFSALFLPNGDMPIAGQTIRNPALGQTLRRLAEAGLSDFYQGKLARSIAADLEAAGSPVRGRDLQMQRAEMAEPLSVRLQSGLFHNCRPPTQGAASLLILALAERLGVTGADTPEDIHKWVEATKLAFRYRDAEIADPAIMHADPQALLDDAAALDRMAAKADLQTAAPWPHPPQLGDTTWFGVIDGNGCAVSMIQSLYFEFGSGVVLPQTGIVWQNRGASFDLRPNLLRSLAPGRKPFHTLNPAMAHLNDGSTLSYGTMGGEGQPQTQAAIVARAVLAGQELQGAITAPRWLLGRTWGDTSTSLKLESRFDPALIEALRRMGHEVEILTPFATAMGHAGALRRYADGTLEGATDPRSDGAVAAW
ncbi:gamma-glutamyltransferase family protein [Kozakia baliensis]|uniref:Gamma-glutamyltransferase n=1 Tax=Kozakia baliensis TaxID=153496 RepID=A0A1D8US16_9PROT|nr:gamma-glutamyltransferase [Kozakia baliensis]AOX16439.1 gamma-glutamyltransferase [Kozakia baliensis]GBR28993.1 gamma-glutamyltranspeptidase [Kozakia baliensis NRIC 0488]GEL63480.1 gamma-glutamyltranspeptidase [Kozakia baliensis]